MNVFIRIALPRGEWAEAVEKYLTSFGLNVSIAGNQKLVRRYRTNYGVLELRLIRAYDVPRAVGRSLFPGDVPYFAGITGLDFFLDAIYGGRFGEIEAAGTFDGGDKTGRIVLYKKIGATLRRNPRIVARNDYRNLAMYQLEEYFGKRNQNADLGFVTGSDEGYVSSGEADAGYGLTVKGETFEREKIVTVEEFINPVVPVVVVNNGTTRKDFELFLRSAGQINCEIEF